LRLFVAGSRYLTRSDVWDAPLWLSAVVEELYAVANTRAFDAVTDLKCEFMAGNKIPVPAAERLTNDAPIAMSAGRMGIVVVTTNPKDFPELSRVSHVSIAARRAMAG